MANKIAILFLFAFVFVISALNEARAAESTAEELEIQPIMIGSVPSPKEIRKAFGDTRARPKKHRRVFTRRTTTRQPLTTTRSTLNKNQTIKRYAKLERQTRKPIRYYRTTTQPPKTESRKPKKKTVNIAGNVKIEVQELRGKLPTSGSG